MTNSIIAIKGDHLKNTDLVFKTFRCVDLNNDLHFDSPEKALTYVFDNYGTFADKNIGLKGIACHNDWTIFFDAELVDAADTEKITELSKKLNSLVYTFISEKLSGHIEFSKIDSAIIRHFCYADNEIIISRGTPLTEEQDLNFNDKVFYDDLLNLSVRLNIDIRNFKDTTVKQLGFDEDFKKELEEEKKIMALSKQTPKKPWWKIW